MGLSAHVQWISYSCDRGYVPTTATLALTRNEDTVRCLGGQQHRNDRYAPCIWNWFICCKLQAQTVQAGG